MSASGKLQIYNTESKSIQEFVPLKAGQVTMYVCGPTVYQLLHVGNFRGPVVFNMVRNWLEYAGYKVTFALNFTDVDDKIIKSAHEQKIDSAALANKYIDEYKKDFQLLGLRPHDMNPTVTESMPEIISMIGELIEKKKAYVAENDVLYSIASFPPYGKLSGHNPEDLIAGSRVEVDHKKHNSLDFALWKGAKPGEPFWSSPWGKGRPGWHIECSAMIRKIFGEQIDIHGGGMDLIFPHHENEIAQSEGCSGHPFVNTWMHVAMLNFGGQKMSKSVGNIVSLRAFLEQHKAELYKWLILSIHYRSVCDFSPEAIHRAVSGLARIYSALSVAESYAEKSEATDPVFDKIMAEAWLKFEAAMNDDFSTPSAFAAVFEVVRTFNTQVKRGQKANPALQAKSVSLIQFLRKVGSVMSLFQEPASQFLLELDDMLLHELKIERSVVDKIVIDRVSARAAKDFKKSDEYRDQLLAMGISVMDTAGGSVWEVTK
jgi:cysteinyl-tRNA synthetase